MQRWTVDDVVVTKYPVGTRADDLGVRLRTVSRDPVRALFNHPLSPTPLAAPDGRLLTLEPATERPTRDRPHWREAGALVARLQACPVPGGVPEHGGRALLAASVTRADALHPGGSTDVLRELGRTLLRTFPTASDPVLTHGALRLATIGRLPDTPSWLLTDPGILGVGTPAWDLGRPAGMWAAGLLDAAGWRAFREGYAEAGGRLPTRGHWDALDHPARCAVFMAAVDEVERCGDYPDIEFTPTAEALLKACVRINGRFPAAPEAQPPDDLFAPSWMPGPCAPDADAHGILTR